MAKWTLRLTSIEETALSMIGAKYQAGGMTKIQTVRVILWAVAMADPEIKAALEALSRSAADQVPVIA